LRWIGFLTALFIAFSAFGKVEIDRDGKLFQRGVYQYKIGSYSTALNYFLELLKPGSKYYKDALLMLAKTYYAIGKKTGMKRYLWQGLNYLQLYFIEVGQGELPWDYYYTKAKLYEALSFYEQALAVYRVAFLKAKTREEKVRTTIGIIRASVWIRRPEAAEEYLILISGQKLSPEEERELTFVKGLALFSQGKYAQALPYFFKLYKRYEEYLIDNPSYYLLVAENIYRLGKLTLAEQLFRRIASLTKDREVVRKAILRLGDIELKRGNYKLAFVNYYSVVRDYPNSLEAAVARLKIIPMKEVKREALLTGDEAFKEPIKYIASLLVNYRTTYVGIYALADLGYLVFNLGSPKEPFKRLTWEVSLVFPEEVKFEQREFLKYLWEPYLLELPPKEACQLYRANPRFFKEIFGREVLLKFVKDLKTCNMRRLRLELLKYMVDRWKEDRDRLLMAQALFEMKDFKNALKVLNRVKEQSSCSYLLLLGKISIFYPAVKFNPTEIEEACQGQESLEAAAIAIYYLSKSGKIESAFIKFLNREKELIKTYGRELVVKASLNKLLEEATLKGKYDVVYTVSRALYRGGYKDCFVGSYYLLSSVRTGRLEEARGVYREVEPCVDFLSELAKLSFQNTLLEREVRDGAIWRVKAD